MPQAVGAGLGAAEVVAIEKAAGKMQEMIIIERDPSRQQLGDMNDIVDIAAGQLAGIGDFPLAVGTVAGDDNTFYNLAHITAP